MNLTDIFNDQIAHYAATDSTLRRSIADAAAETDTEPTFAMKDAGNYRKGRFAWNGLQIVIENPAGSTRKGCSRDGHCWEQLMPFSYGYLSAHFHRGVQLSESDGDQIDCFLGPDPESELIFAVDQQKPDGSHDEHKLMIGWHSEAEAREAYLASYQPGWKGLKNITAMTLPAFREWLENGDTRKPVARYELAHNVAHYGSNPIPALIESGEYLKTQGLMPGYGQIFIKESGRGEAWYVGGDGDERGFGDLVKKTLMAIEGIDEIEYSAEGFPPKDKGWIQVYPKRREWVSGRSEHSRTDHYALVQEFNDLIAQYASLFKEEEHPRADDGEFRKKESAGATGPKKPSKKPAAEQETLFAISDQGTLFGRQAPKVGTIDTLQPKPPDKTWNAPKLPHEMTLAEFTKGIKKKKGEPDDPERASAIAELHYSQIAHAIKSGRDVPETVWRPYRERLAEDGIFPERIDAAKTESPLDALTVKQAAPLAGQKAMTELFDRTIAAHGTSHQKALYAFRDTDHPRDDLGKFIPVWKHVMDQIDPGAGKGALIPARELRRATGLPKKHFDELAIRLGKSGQFSLHRHDYVSSLSDADRDELIHDPDAADYGHSGAKGLKGAYYVGMAVRSPGATQYALTACFDAAFAQYGLSGLSFDPETIRKSVQAINDRRHPDSRRAEFDAIRQTPKTEAAERAANAAVPVHEPAQPGANAGQSRENQAASKPHDGGSGKDRWITIGAHNHHGGTPVKIDSEGKIEAGPAAIEGKKVDDLPPRSEGESNPEHPGITEKDVDKFRDKKGFADGKEFAAHVTSTVQSQLTAGNRVTFDIEDKQVPIVAIKDGMMQDQKGQRWGTMAIMSGDAKVTFHKKPAPQQKPPAGKPTADFKEAPENEPEEPIPQEDVRRKALPGWEDFRKKQRDADRGNERGKSGGTQESKPPRSREENHEENGGTTGERSSDGVRLDVTFNNGRWTAQGTHKGKFIYRTDENREAALAKARGDVEAEGGTIANETATDSQQKPEGLTTKPGESKPEDLQSSAKDVADRLFGDYQGKVKAIQQAEARGEFAPGKALEASNQAWQDYQHGLDQHGVISTLAGYQLKKGAGRPAAQAPPPAEASKPAGSKTDTSSPTSPKSSGKSSGITYHNPDDKESDDRYFAHQTAQAHAEVAAAHKALAEAKDQHAEHKAHIEKLKSDLSAYEKHISELKSELEQGRIKRQAAESILSNPQEQRRKKGAAKAVATKGNNKEELNLYRIADAHGVPASELRDAVDQEMVKDSEHWDSLHSVVSQYPLTPSQRKKLREGDVDSLPKYRFDELKDSLEEESGELRHLGLNFDQVFEAIRNGMPPKPSMADEEYVSKVARQMEPGGHGEGHGGRRAPVAVPDDDNVPFSLAARGELIAHYARQFNDAIARYVSA